MLRLMALLWMAGCAAVGIGNRPDGQTGAGVPPVDNEQLVTVAESSGYTRTATHEQVVAFVDALADRSDRVYRGVLGETSEGREIPLLVIADPPVDGPGNMGGVEDRLVVLLFGDIHAGEVCGKEALLMLARELALSPEAPLLDDLVVAIVPIYNADGNERFSPDNRPGQVGPEEMGQRANGQGLDLNRDWVKLEAPETRAFVRFLNEWDPAVIVDTHTTNGSHHRYTITYQGPKHPAGDAEVIGYVRDTMLPAISEAMRRDAGYESFFYGNFADKHTRWTTYPAGPRYGTAYRGLRNRVAILSEAYAYATYKDRVLGTRAFCESILSYAAKHAGEIRKLERDADARVIRAGRSPGADDVVPVRFEARPLPGKATVLGFEEYNEAGERVEPGEPREYEVEVVNDFVSTLSVPRAWAYLLPADQVKAVRLLQRHGVEVRELREDIELDAETYTVDGFDRTLLPFEKHRMVRDVRVTKRTEAVAAKAGWYVVRTDQALGMLASYVLEPEADDGFTAWNVFEGAPAKGEVFPVYRLPASVPLTTCLARALPEDIETGRRITYESLYESDHPPRLNGSPVGGLRWLDDGHYVQRKGGKVCVVEAESGRVETREVDPGEIADRLSEHPAIERDKAGRIASRWFGRVDPASKGVVFEHADDLYFARPDGSDPVRLTSTPAREELSSLSPDGKFVAFVRDNDLWVVDVTTQTERALTTGGSATLRHGKADWVYYEEVFGRSWRTYWWSPDSRRIAFLEMDSSRVPEFTIVDNRRDEQRVESARYPKPGDPNPTVRVGIVDRAGGAVRWVDLSAYDTDGFLVTGVRWKPDGSTLRLFVQDRVQTWLDVLEAGGGGGGGVGGGKPKLLLRDRTEAWIEPPRVLRDLADGSVLISSERDGWNHLYLYDDAGGLVRQVTSGPWEVRAVHHVDEENGWVYFTGTTDSHIASNFYRVRLDGTQMQRLTAEPGSHRVSVSPEGTYFIDTWSAHDTPPRVALRRSDGDRVRWIDTNPVYELEQYELGEFSLHEIPTERGPTLQASVLLPSGFDPAGSYPVWFMTYAGPHAPTINDSWGGGRLWDQMLASMGIVVFRADPHPASGRGGESAWTAYKQLGVREMQDIADAIAWLKERPYIDGSRIGMSGHSYGGYITAYAMTHSELFAAGIAGAPVTDWRDYDSIYTERYMDTPQNNPEGYEASSVTSAAGNLHGRLLILHGDMDDNVHLQNTIRLVSALEKAGKAFEMVVYPGSRHGIWGKHYRDLRVNFIRRTMLGEVAPIMPTD